MLDKYALTVGAKGKLFEICDTRKTYRQVMNSTVQGWVQGCFFLSLRRPIPGRCLRMSAGSQYCRQAWVRQLIYQTLSVFTEIGPQYLWFSVTTSLSLVYRTAFVRFLFHRLLNIANHDHNNTRESWCWDAR